MYKLSHFTTRYIVTDHILSLYHFTNPVHLKNIFQKGLIPQRSSGAIEMPEYEEGVYFCDAKDAYEEVRNHHIGKYGTVLKIAFPKGTKLYRDNKMGIVSAIYAGSVPTNWITKISIEELQEAANRISENDSLSYLFEKGEQKEVIGLEGKMKSGNYKLSSQPDKEVVAIITIHDPEAPQATSSDSGDVFYLDITKIHYLYENPPDPEEDHSEDIYYRISEEDGNNFAKHEDIFETVDDALKYVAEACEANGWLIKNVEHINKENYYKLSNQGEKVYYFEIGINDPTQYGGNNTIKYVVEHVGDAPQGRQSYFTIQPDENQDNESFTSLQEAIGAIRADVQRNHEIVVNEGEVGDRNYFKAFSEIPEGAYYFIETNKDTYFLLRFPIPTFATSKMRKYVYFAEASKIGILEGSRQTSAKMSLHNLEMYIFCKEETIKNRGPISKFPDNYFKQSESKLYKRMNYMLSKTAARPQHGIPMGYKEFLKLMVDEFGATIETISSTTTDHPTKIVLPNEAKTRLTVSKGNWKNNVPSDLLRQISRAMGVPLEEVKQKVYGDRRVRRDKEELSENDRIVLSYLIEGLQRVIKGKSYKQEIADLEAGRTTENLVTAGIDACGSFLREGVLFKKFENDFDKKKIENLNNRLKQISKDLRSGKTASSKNKYLLAQDTNNTYKVAVEAVNSSYRYSSYQLANEDIDKLLSENTERVNDFDKSGWLSPSGVLYNLNDDEYDHASFLRRVFKLSYRDYAKVEYTAHKYNLIRYIDRANVELFSEPTSQQYSSLRKNVDKNEYIIEYNTHDYKLGEVRELFRAKDIKTSKYNKQAQLTDDNEKLLRYLVEALQEAGETDSDAVSINYLCNEALTKLDRGLIDQSVLEIGVEACHAFLRGRTLFEKFENLLNKNSVKKLENELQEMLKQNKRAFTLTTKEAARIPIVSLKSSTKQNPQLPWYTAIPEQFEDGYYKRKDSISKDDWYLKTPDGEFGKVVDIYGSVGEISVKVIYQSGPKTGKEERLSYREKAKVYVVKKDDFDRLKQEILDRRMKSKEKRENYFKLSQQVQAPPAQQLIQGQGALSDALAKQTAQLTYMVQSFAKEVWGINVPTVQAMKITHKLIADMSNEIADIPAQAILDSIDAYVDATTPKNQPGQTKQSYKLAQTNKNSYDEDEIYDNSNWNIVEGHLKDVRQGDYVSFQGGRNFLLVSEVIPYTKNTINITTAEGFKLRNRRLSEDCTIARQKNKIEEKSYFKLSNWHFHWHPHLEEYVKMAVKVQPAYGTGGRIIPNPGDMIWLEEGKAGGSKSKMSEWVKFIAEYPGTSVPTWFIVPMGESRPVPLNQANLHPRAYPPTNEGNQKGKEAAIDAAIAYFRNETYVKKNRDRSWEINEMQKWVNKGLEDGVTKCGYLLPYPASAFRSEPVGEGKDPGAWIPGPEHMKDNKTYQETPRTGNRRTVEEVLKDPNLSPEQRRGYERVKALEDSIREEEYDPNDWK